MSRRSVVRAVTIWLVASLFVFYKYIIEMIYHFGVIYISFDDNHNIVYYIHAYRGVSAKWS